MTGDVLFQEVRLPFGLQNPPHLSTLSLSVTRVCSHLCEAFAPPVSTELCPRLTASDCSPLESTYESDLVR